MKKLAAIIALAFVFGISTPAFAEDNKEDKKAKTEKTKCCSEKKSCCDKKAKTEKEEAKKSECKESGKKEHKCSGHSHK